MSDNMVMLNDGRTITASEFLANRRAEGFKIDPATATVHWTWAYVPDPYGIFTLDPEEKCVGRMYYAISPESGMVWFGDLSQATQKALWERIKSGRLSFEDDDLSWLNDRDDDL